MSDETETEPVELPPTVVDYIAAIPDVRSPTEIWDEVKELKEMYQNEGSNSVDAAVVLCMSATLRNKLLSPQDLLEYDRILNLASLKLNAMTNMPESAKVVRDIYQRSLEKGHQ